MSPRRHEPDKLPAAVTVCVNSSLCSWANLPFSRCFTSRSKAHKRRTGVLHACRVDEILADGKRRAVAIVNA